MWLRQDSELQLRRLLAQRRLYSRAKQVLGGEIVTTVALNVFFSIIVLLVPPLKVWAAVYGLVAVGLDFIVFAPLQESLKKRAAGIQEVFDCEALGMPWQEIKTGSPPDTETVAEWSRLKSGETYESLKLRQWYPAEADALPPSIGRIVCQRANCWWDARLRRRYAIWVGAFLGTVFLVIVIVAVLGGMTLEQFLLAGVVPFLPVFTIGIRQIMDQRQAATRLDDLKKHTERFWHDALSGQIPDPELLHRSRTLQDEIFDQRRRNPPIFDWLYNRLRHDAEELMNRTASDLVAEARSSPRSELDID